MPAVYCSYCRFVHTSKFSEIDVNFLLKWVQIILKFLMDWGAMNNVFFFLQHGANANAVDSNGHTALFRACERGHTEVVVVLMNAGALWDLQDTSGRTCLHWAASGGHAAICSSLIHKGLPADSQDSGG